MAEKDLLVNIAEISAEFLKELKEESGCGVPDMRQALLDAQQESVLKEASSLEYKLICMQRSKVVYEPKIGAFNGKRAALIIAVKKAICKLCRFWGEPLTDQINTYHGHVNEAMRAVNERLNRLEQENNQLRTQVDALERQLKAYGEQV